MLIHNHVLKDNYEACAGGVWQVIFICWLLGTALFVIHLIRKPRV